MLEQAHRVGGYEVSEGSKIEDVSPEEAMALQDGGAVLVDVRENDEWSAGHAPTAVHLPLGEVEGSVARFEGKTVLTVCRSGGRSAKAAQMLAVGGVDVRNVAGGMTAWMAGGLPVVSNDGTDGTVS